MVCLKHEDLSTAEIEERCVAGWVRTRGDHGPPGDTVAAAGPRTSDSLRGRTSLCPMSETEHK
jgi:hypothetical protein